MIFEEEKFGEFTIFNTQGASFMLKNNNDNGITLRYSNFFREKAQFILDEFCDFKQNSLLFINNIVFDNCFFEKINLIPLLKNFSECVKVTFMHSEFVKMTVPNQVTVDLQIYNTDHILVYKTFEVFRDASIVSAEITCTKISVNTLIDIENLLKNGNKHRLDKLYFFDNRPCLAGGIVINGKCVRLTEEESRRIFKIKHFKPFISYVTKARVPLRSSVRYSYVHETLN